MFPVVTVTLTYLIVVITVKEFQHVMAYVLGLSIGSFTSK